MRRGRINYHPSVSGFGDEPSRSHICPVAETLADASIARTDHGYASGNDEGEDLFSCSCTHCQDLSCSCLMCTDEQEASEISLSEGSRRCAVSTGAEARPPSRAPPAHERFTQKSIAGVSAAEDSDGEYSTCAPPPPPPSSPGWRPWVGSAEEGEAPRRPPDGNGDRTRRARGSLVLAVYFRRRVLLLHCFLAWYDRMERRKAERADDRPLLRRTFLMWGEAATESSERVKGVRMLVRGAALRRHLKGELTGSLRRWKKATEVVAVLLEIFRAWMAEARHIALARGIVQTQVVSRLREQKLAVALRLWRHGVRLSQFQARRDARIRYIIFLVWRGRTMSMGRIRWERGRRLEVLTFEWSRRRLERALQGFQVHTIIMKCHRKAALNLIKVIKQRSLRHALGKWFHVHNRKMKIRAAAHRIVQCYQLAECRLTLHWLKYFSRVLAQREKVNLLIILNRWRTLTEDSVLRKSKVKLAMRHWAYTMCRRALLGWKLATSQERQERTYLRKIAVHNNVSKKLENFHSGRRRADGLSKESMGAQQFGMRRVTSDAVRTLCRQSKFAHQTQALNEPHCASLLADGVISRNVLKNCGSKNAHLERVSLLTSRPLAEKPSATDSYLVDSRGNDISNGSYIPRKSTFLTQGEPHSYLRSLQKMPNIDCFRPDAIRMGLLQNYKKRSTKAMGHQTAKYHPNPLSTQSTTLKEISARVPYWIAQELNEMRNDSQRNKGEVKTRSDKTTRKQAFTLDRKDNMPDVDTAMHMAPINIVETDRSNLSLFSGKEIVTKKEMLDKLDLLQNGKQQELQDPLTLGHSSSNQIRFFDPTTSTAVSGRTQLLSHSFSLECKGRMEPFADCSHYVNQPPLSYKDSWHLSIVRSLLNEMATKVEARIQRPVLQVTVIGTSQPHAQDFHSEFQGTTEHNDYWDHSSVVSLLGVMPRKAEKRMSKPLWQVTAREETQPCAQEVHSEFQGGRKPATGCSQMKTLQSPVPFSYKTSSFVSSTVASVLDELLGKVEASISMMRHTKPLGTTTLTSLESRTPNFFENTLVLSCPLSDKTLTQPYCMKTAKDEIQGVCAQEKAPNNSKPQMTSSLIYNPSNQTKFSDPRIETKLTMLHSILVQLTEEKSRIGRLGKKDGLDQWKEQMEPKVRHIKLLIQQLRNQLTG